MSAGGNNSKFKKLPAIGNIVVPEIFYGKYTSLPIERSSIVKIFLSSTFSDFKAERNILYSIAFPKIRDFCNSIDLDFQFVDMRYTHDVIFIKINCFGFFFFF